MKLFGTDGIRGKANRFPMTSEVMVRVGRAVAEELGARSSHKPRVVLGKDTRLSGYMIEQAIASGICAAGADVWLVGPLPTPGIAFITQSMRADAGIVISASHNPYDDNGIKIFDRNGLKLPDEIENRIEQKVLQERDITEVGPEGLSVGKAHRIDDAIGRYVVYLKSLFPRDLDLTSLKIVVDCAHGAAYKVAPSVFEELGATVIKTGCAPTGTNINDHVGALHPDHVQGMVKNSGADLGIALDGDGDRIMLSTERGELVDGDHVLAMMAREKLHRGPIVGTLMSNYGVEKYIKSHGVDFLRASVGDRFVAELMRKNQSNLGGEPSGHIIFSDYSTTGDGIVAALKVMEVMLRSKKTLSALIDEIPKMPQRLKNIKVARREELGKIPGYGDAEKKVKILLGDRGRYLVRYSGTENLLRLMVEAENEALVDEALGILEHGLRTIT